MVDKIQEQLDQWILEIQRSAEKALLSVGEYAKDQLIAHEADSDTTGRLRDSFTYATQGNPSKPGPQALASDAIDTPNQPLQLVIGTNCPYAAGVNYGLEPGEVESASTLLPKIEKWLSDKGIESFKGWSKEKLAAKITSNLIEYGSMAHEFWEPALAQVRAKSSDIIKAQLSKGTNLKGINVTTQIRL